MATEATIWESYEKLEADREAWQDDVEAQRQAFRNGEIDHITDEPIRDIVVALHGLEGITDPTKLQAWQDFSDRFEGHQDEPFLVIQRVWGESRKRVLLRPRYSLGTIDDRPFAFENNGVDLRSRGPLTTASMFGDGYKPYSSNSKPLDLAYNLINGTVIDRVVEQLDQPANSLSPNPSNPSLVMSDFTPYEKLAADWYSDKQRYHHPDEYNVPHPLNVMSIMEVIVGHQAIIDWIHESAVGKEDIIVAEALKYHVEHSHADQPA